MAITIDYLDDVTPEYIIQIPRLDMTDVTGGSPTEIRELDIDVFRGNLDDLMDDESPGIVFETTHLHTPPLTIAGITLARVVEILVPYRVEFEDGSYNVNVVGGNSNIADVQVKNMVGVNTANSAGFIQVSVGSGLSAAQDALLTLIHQFLANKLITDPITGIATLYDNAGLPLETSQMYEDAAGTITYKGTGAERREKFS